MAVSIESGSITKFFNPTAPVGWTKLTTNDDCAVRIVSGSTSPGGTKGFSAVFATQPVSGDITLGPLTLATTASGSPTHTHLFPYAWSSSSGQVPSSFSGTLWSVFGSSGIYGTSSVAGSNVGHSHPISAPGPITVPGSLGFAVKYVDALVAQRN